MYKMMHAVFNTEVDVQVYNSLSKEQNEGTNLNDLIKTALYELLTYLLLVHRRAEKQCLFRPHHFLVKSVLESIDCGRIHSRLR